jgi:hypothetical protein
VDLVPEKKCDGCVKIRSDEWNLTKELAVSNRRRFVAIIFLISLWLVTVFAFLWHIKAQEKGSYTNQQTDNLEIACSGSVEQGFLDFSA